MVEGRGGESIYDHWADGPETLHGMMTHGFPNQFFIGYIQGGFNATVTEQFGQQGHHIAYIISEALKRGAAVVEPSQEAQDDYVQHFEETEIDISEFQRECTPSYFNNEGEDEAEVGPVPRRMGRAGMPSRSCCRSGATRATWRASSS